MAKTTKIPIIVDTDFGSDPDDIIALRYLLKNPKFRIVGIFTNDEYKRKLRAQLVSNFCKLVGEYQPPVFYGKDLGNTRLFSLQKYVVCSKDIKVNSLIKSGSEIKKILHLLIKENGVYLSIGTFSNLAYCLNTFPDEIKKIKIVAMGGTINDATKTEHNIRVDIKSAISVLRNLTNLYLIVSNTTFVPELMISNSHWLYKLFVMSKEPCDKMIVENMNYFYKYYYKNSYLHDPLVLFSIIDPKAVTFERNKFVVTDEGRILTRKGEIELKTSHNVNIYHFNEWLKSGLCCK